MEKHGNSTGASLTSGFRTLAQRFPGGRKRVAIYARAARVRSVHSIIRSDSRYRRKPTAPASGNAVTGGAGWDAQPGTAPLQRIDPLLIPGFGPASRWCDRIAEGIVATVAVAALLWVLQ